MKMIKIDGAALAPHLEGFMSEILNAIKAQSDFEFMFLSGKIDADRQRVFELSALEEDKMQEQLAEKERLLMEIQR